MPGFAHLLSTLSPSFLPLAWAKGGNCLALPTFHPPFPHPSYLLHGRRAGNCLASPTFRPPFPHPSYPLHGRRVGIAWLCPPFVHPCPILLTPCMGEGWDFSDCSHLSTTLSSSILPLVWVKGGNYLALPTFRPPFPHPSYPLYGRRVGIAWLLPPFVHPFPTLHSPCLSQD